MGGNLTILGDLLQTEKAKLSWDKFKTCEFFFTKQLPWISIQVLVREPYIVSCSNKNVYIIIFKNIKNIIKFFFHRGEKVSKLDKKPESLYLITFCCVSVWSSRLMVCKIELKQH